MVNQPPRSVLVSAGEASGDFYASLLVEELRRRWPETLFFGCTGPRLRDAGVETVVRSESLAVVGIVEVLAHIPRIFVEYLALLAAARKRKPELAILTDSPDFHLRVARRLAARGIPVIYLVAPQVWAWRTGRLPMMRQVLSRVLCIFPFEQEFFRSHGVPARYIGHPLVPLVKPQLSKIDFFRKHSLAFDRQLVTVLPGSRRGESLRHLPPILEAAGAIQRARPVQFLLPASPNTGVLFFRERIGAAPIQVIEGEAWDAIAHADLALAASGTVTVEAALLGTPMVTFYKVNPISWLIGRVLVQVPFYTMVNLIAGRKVVPELMQNQMTPANLASEACRLLDNPELAAKMREDLSLVRQKLSSQGDAMSRAADEVLSVRENRAVQIF